MKKYLVIVFMLLMPKISIAGDICLNMLCSDCDASYTQQHLRIKDVVDATTFSGYVQANDNSFGVPAYMVIKGSSLIFSRVAGNGVKTYFYDVDLTTWNGTSITGVRHAAKYSHSNGVPYTKLSDNLISMEIMSCP